MYIGELIALLETVTRQKAPACNAQYGQRSDRIAFPLVSREKSLLTFI